MKPSPRALCSAASLWLLAAGPVCAERYVIDSVHSRVLIRVSHAGFAQAMATLSAPRGFIDFTAEAPDRARVQVELPLDRLDFGDDDWNRRMARRDYFDSERHPLARFVSDTVQPTADGELRINGRLELRGTRVPVELRARINRLGRAPPYVPRTRLGASATAKLDRRDFGMNRHAGAVGHEVEIWIEVEARRQRHSDRDDESDANAPHDIDATESAAEPALDPSADSPHESTEEPQRQGHTRHQEHLGERSSDTPRTAGSPAQASAVPFQALYPKSREASHHAIAQH